MNAFMPKINYYSSASNPEFNAITIRFREEKSFFYVDIELDDNLHTDIHVEVENGYIKILPDKRHLQYSIPAQPGRFLDRLIKLPENVDDALFKKTVYKNHISLIFPIKTEDSLFQMYY